MGLHRVFVYGTLKTGQPNHNWLGNAKCLGPGHTLETYPLIIATQYNIPFLLYAPGQGSLVKGEIYEVDDAMLANLDILEDHPNFYIRNLYTVALEDVENHTESNVECWIYFLKTFKPELLLKTTYSSYDSSGDHNLPYLERSKRDPNAPLNI